MICIWRSKYMHFFKKGDKMQDRIFLVSSLQYGKMIKKIQTQDVEIYNKTKIFFNCEKYELGLEVYPILIMNQWVKDTYY